MPDKLRRDNEGGPVVNFAVLRIPFMPGLTNCGPKVQTIRDPAIHGHRKIDYITGVQVFYCIVWSLVPPIPLLVLSFRSLSTRPALAATRSCTLFAIVHPRHRLHLWSSVTPKESLFCMPCTITHHGSNSFSHNGGRTYIKKRNDKSQSAPLHSPLAHSAEHPSLRCQNGQETRRVGLFCREGRGFSRDHR